MAVLNSRLLVLPQGSSSTSQLVASLLIIVVLFFTFVFILDLPENILGTWQMCENLFPS